MRTFARAARPTGPGTVHLRLHPAWMLFTLLLALADVPPARGAARVPEGFTLSLVAGGLPNATAMQFAPDGRLFVCQQGGEVRIIKNGRLLPTPFVKVDAASERERGLMGIAFDPDFPTNGHLYLFYTARSPFRRNRISRLVAEGDQAIPGSERALFELGPLRGEAIHTGGAMQFGPDGYLYVATGDEAVPANAQSLANLAGKILRIRGDGAIPESNPFYHTARGPQRAIWALGLRNPYTFDIERPTGRVFINDVGQDTWEEINEGAPGANFGWPLTEGPTGDRRFRSPLLAYPHGAGGARGCAITGGAFYRPDSPRFPVSYVGKYFFADFCNGWIRLLDPERRTSTLFATGIFGPADLKVNSDDGALYVLARGDNAVYRISYEARSRPAVTRHPEDFLASLGRPASFQVSASGAGPLRYQWLRNGVDVGGVNGPGLTLPAVTLVDHGARFRCVVSNQFGSTRSEEAVLTVTEDQPPAASIHAPLEGLRYRGGQRIRFSGSARDPEDGDLPGSAFRWRVDFHHAGHVHPFMPERPGVREGNFTVPTSGETAANVYYRIHLTVRDARGLTHTVYRDIHPLTVRLRVETQPPGLDVLLDGQPGTAPLEVESVVGTIRSLGAPSPQFRGGAAFLFRSWSDGGDAFHPMTTPDAERVCTAIYEETRKPVLKELKLTSSLLKRGTTGRGRVVFSRPVRTVTRVALSSSNPAAGRVPRIVVVRRGRRSAGFRIRPKSWGPLASTVIRARHGGVSQEATLTADP